MEKFAENLRLQKQRPPLVFPLGKDGVLETLLQALGRFVEEQGRFRLYECFVDGTVSKAKGGGDGIRLQRESKS
jgi:hypothetical protein